MSFQYLGVSHYPWERHGGAAFRTLSQAHEWCMESGAVCCVDQIAEAKNGNCDADSWTVHGCNQWLRKVNVGIRVISKRK